MSWTWLSVACPTCGAAIDEECFETSRLWGRMPLTGINRLHDARIEAIIRSPDNPGRVRL